MNQTLQELDYKKVFQYFSEISAVPRGSGHNTAISNYLVEYAEKKGLSHRQDEYENVVMIKEATPGYENAPALILQGHMDMVCEKTNDCTHDFGKEGIELFVEGDNIHADRTTLGGDDGIALAYILALFDDDTLQHPRLEAVITTDEETGMDGAIGLDVSDLKAKILLNIDSEEEGILLTSSAGGLTATCELPVKRMKENGLKVVIAISDLKGGHSGAEIHKNHVNATKLMARLLFELKEAMDFHLAELSGGLKDNAIPRDSKAEIVIEEDEFERFSDIIGGLSRKYKNEYVTNEPDLTIGVMKGEEDEYRVLHPTSFEKLLFILLNTPNGVQNMSSDIPGLVESSLNLGIFHMEQEKAVICFSVRSSVNSYKEFIAKQLRYICEFMGGEFFIRGQYPAWEYKKDSLLRDYLSRVYEEEYKKEPKLEAIHAGLECSFFAEKVPGIDMVSLGPDMWDIHTPKERLSISSTVRVYKYLEKVIEGMKNL